MTIAEVAISGPKEVILEFPSEVGKTNGLHAAFKLLFSGQRMLQGGYILL